MVISVSWDGFRHRLDELRAPADRRDWCPPNSQNKTKKGEFQKYHIYQTPLEIIIMKFAGRSDFVLQHQDKIFIARLYGYYKRPSYVYTKRKGNTLSAGSKVFGTYTLAMDTVAPTIKPVNFQDKKFLKWLLKYD